MTLQIIYFSLSALVIIFAGTRLTRVCDELADRTGLGEAIIGAVFLGAVTSLPGITASVTAAATDAPRLALSNAYGGIAAQTLFIAFADLFYRKANLEHAAASLENMLMGVTLIVLLSLLVFAAATPTLSVFHIHPVSLLLPFAYGASLFMMKDARAHPMWRAQDTAETNADVPEPANEDLSRHALMKRWGTLAALAGAIIGSGWLLTRSTQRICEATGLDQSLAGALIVAIVTSLPELITAVAAVRQGALTLAVGGVLGGNGFDTLFAAVADYAYRPGPIYDHVSLRETGILAISLAMAGVVLMGLLKRQRHGPGGIGFESVAILAIYCVGMGCLFLMKLN